MADELVIDRVGVVTEELIELARRLHELAREAASVHARLAVVDRLVGWGALVLAGAPSAAGRAEAEIDRARAALMQAELSARILGFALDLAVDGYTWVESVAGQLVRQAAGGVAATAGFFLPGLLLTGAGSAVLGATGGLAAASRALPGGLGGVVERAMGGDGVPAASPAAREHNRLITNPVTAGVVREATQLLGVASLGATRMPVGLATALGSTGAGLSFLAGGGMRAGAAFGMFRETPVRAVEATPVPVEGSPTGFADRLARVPDTDETGGAQVVIERYQQPGTADRFEVYVAGTVTFSPVADSEPWDMTSNLANAAGYGGGSYAAVREAMLAAGITPESPVQFTGYSQGGGTVARLAASGEWNTQGVASFGGPTGQVPLPIGIPVVLVEHSDDIVPALGGVQANRDAVLVERDVFGGRELPKDYAVPAHRAEYYAETAALMDAERNRRLDDAIRKLDGFGAGARTVTATAYRFERVSGDDPGR